MTATGPFYANSGPTDGPIRGLENSPTTGFFKTPECRHLIGIAYPRGVVNGGRGRPIVAFRLVLEPFAPHRGRVARLVEVSGELPDRHGPRYQPRDVSQA